jgi:hypothetical protein
VNEYSVGPGTSELSQLCRQAVSFLEQMRCEHEGLFPFSTTLEDGRYRSDCGRPSEMRRYTLICLLGLDRAARSEPAHPFLSKTGDLVESFSRRHFPALASQGDVGLFALLLARRGDAVPLQSQVLKRLSTALEAPPRRFTMQDLAWMLWGAVEMAKHGLNGAGATSDRIFTLICDHFVDGRSSLPRHSTLPHRRDVVSFGALAYFLRSIYEYAEYRSNEAAFALFRKALFHTLRLQGRNGEWPWMIDARSGRVLDPYPVFSVHQLSMGMLFVLPAMNGGLISDRDVVARSVGWVLGKNELATPLVVHEPFFIYRSVQRREVLPKARRYIRSVINAAKRREPQAVDPSRLAINLESRSYEWGWLLDVWAGRPEAPVFKAADEESHSSARRTS